MDLSSIQEIWVPVIYITNALSVEKLGSFGGDEMISFWYKHSSVFQYNEVLKVRINCEMDFQNFPFDIQECLWKLRNWKGETKNVRMNNPKIWYHDEGRTSKGSETTEIMLKSNKLNFDAYLNSNKTSNVFENGYNYSEAAIKIRLERNNIGLLKIIWGYYVTTATFSMMSLLAFFVDPAMVRHVHTSFDIYIYIYRVFKQQVVFFNPPPD